MLRIIFCILLALFVLPAIGVAQQTFDVYIVAGQSNADGRGEVDDLSAAQLAELENDAIISYLNPGSERERAMPEDDDFDVGSNGFQVWCLVALALIVPAVECLATRLARSLGSAHRLLT